MSAGDFSGYSAGMPPIQTNAVSSGSGRSSSTSQSGTEMIPGMSSVYNQLLGMNEGAYNQALGAYGQGQSQLASGLPSIYSGYNNVQGNVMNTLGMGQVLGQNGNWGVAAPAAQAIGQTFAQNSANTTQQMTNAGLGNTSAVGNAQNQNALTAGQAYSGLGAQLAQTAAGYQSQIGMAGLGAQMTGVQAQSALSGQEGAGLLNHTYSNTAGSLTGGFGSSSSTSQQASGSTSPTGGSGTGSTGQQAYPYQGQGGGNSGFSGASAGTPGSGSPITSGGGDSSGTGGFQSGSGVNVGGGTTGITGSTSSYPQSVQQNPGNYQQLNMQYGPPTNGSPANGYFSGSFNGQNTPVSGVQGQNLSQLYGYQSINGGIAGGMADQYSPGQQAQQQAQAANEDGSQVPGDQPQPGPNYVKITNQQGEVVWAPYNP